MLWWTYYAPCVHLSAPYAPLLNPGFAQTSHSMRIVDPKLFRDKGRRVSATLCWAGRFCLVRLSLYRTFVACFCRHSQFRPYLRPLTIRAQSRLIESGWVADGLVGHIRMNNTSVSVTQWSPGRQSNKSVPRRRGPMFYQRGISKR